MVSTVRKKIDNRLKNAHRSLAKVVVYQKEEVANLTKVIKQYEAIYDKEMTKLEEFEIGTDERTEQQKRVDDVSNKLALYEEAKAQYQLNLSELNAL